MGNQKDIDFLHDKGLSGSLTEMSYQYLRTQTGLLTADRTRMFHQHLINSGFTGQATSDLLQNAASFHGKSSVTDLHNDIGILAMLPVPLSRMKLENNLLLTHGTGVATFTRSTIGTFIDRNDGLVKTAAIDTARFEQNGILIEGASTNLLLRSEEFDNAAWVIGNSGSVTANTDSSPDGNTTADTLTDSDAAQFTDISQTVTITADTNTKTFFIYIKQTTSASVFPGLRVVMGSVNKQVIVNTDTGVVTGRVGFVPDSFSSELINGYWRVKINQANASSASATCGVFPAFSSDGSTLGAASLTGSTITWGAQLEELPFASSYIKTVASTVTRTADNLSIDVANIPASTADYSVSASVDKLGFDTGAFARIYDVAGDTRHLRIDTSNTKFTARHNSTSLSTSSVISGIAFKAVFTVESVNQTLYFDGIQEDQDVKGTVAAGATSIDIGRQGSAQYLFGHIKDFRIYGVALTANQVATL